MAVAMACALVGLAGTAPAAAEVTLRDAWMRPAPAGAEAARAYVDIVSTSPLTLVGAGTPVARRVEIVVVGRIDEPTTERVVASLPVPEGTPTRLAYRGNHLRLVNVDRDLANGTPVPLTLRFKDAKGRPVTATTNVVVRGLLMPQQSAPASRGAPSQVPAAAPQESAPATPKM
jgi:periplasmic copper chaperone A